MNLSPKLERRLSRENCEQASSSTSLKLQRERFRRRFLKNAVARLVVFIVMAGMILFFGAGFVGVGDEFNLVNASLIGVVWTLFRGLFLGGGLLTEVKFSARSRTLLALPAPESLLITSALRHFRRQPLVIWVEFALLIGLGMLARDAETLQPFPFGRWLICTTAALFGALGVATWSMLISSLFRWQLPTDSFFASRAIRTAFFWAIIFVAMIGKPLSTTFSELGDIITPWLPVIPLVGWPSYCFNPLETETAAWLLLYTATTALFPLLFARPLIRKGSAFLSTYACALLASHWRGVKTPPSPSRRPRSSPARPFPGVQNLPEKPSFLSRFTFIENFATQWFTGDERRAMVLHLGHPYPAWTRKALVGSLALLGTIPLVALAAWLEAGALEAAIGIGAFSLMVFALFQILGGATPSGGLAVISLGSFQAPLFAGWPVRVKDLIAADWKVAILRTVAVLPVCVAVAYSVGWSVYSGNASAARAAVNVIVFFLILTAVRPLIFVSSLSSACKKPNMFTAPFWLITIVGLPLVGLITLMSFIAFVMLNLDGPIKQFSGILLAAAVVLPSILLVWNYRVLYNRARICLETRLAEK